MAFRALQRPQTTLLKRFAAVRTNMSESAFHSKFAEQRLGVKHHAGESAENWKKITLFVCIPALLGAGINAYNLYQHHQQHVKEHPHEFVNYEYMNWRVKDFFWGKNSLFFNPKVNHNMEE